VARSQEVARVLSKCLGTRHTYRAKPFEDRTEILISIPSLINYRFRWLVGGHYADQTAIKSAC
jgi:hypothetical protein